jgi:hypothetical protein
MIASQNGHTEVLALLLANGANVNAAEQVIQYFFQYKPYICPKYLSKLICLSLCTNLAFEFRMGILLL